MGACSVSSGAGGCTMAVEAGPWSWFHWWLLSPNPKLTRSVGFEPRIVPGVKPWTYGKAHRTRRV